MHSVKLVVEGHGEVGGGAGGHMGDKGRLALVDRVVHVHAPLADRSIFFRPTVLVLLECYFY